MVGYLLKNTVTDNGHVARGICTTNEEGELVNITERTRIEKRDGKIAFTENDGETWENLPEDTLVSMNMWGLTPDFLKQLGIYEKHTGRAESRISTVPEERTY